MAAAAYLGGIACEELLHLIRNFARRLINHRNMKLKGRQSARPHVGTQVGAHARAHTHKHKLAAVEGS